ncbi:MAG: hypothetical protein O9308_07520 [Beijerinckiaceae bacterium]|nr:hypothetical protein [Beijerinckiaceae bacterium]
MGWAKYFEDIHKLRDHAVSLRDTRLDVRSVDSAPEKAAHQLQYVQESMSRWSVKLIKQLDEILEHATDPEINRQLKIDSQDEKINRLEAEINDRLLQIEALVRLNSVLQSDLDDERRNLSILLESQKVVERNLVAAQNSIETLKIRNLALEKEVQRFQQREREAAEFEILMKNGGVRPIRK